MKVALVNPNWNLHDINYTTTSVKLPKSIPLELAYIASSSSQNFKIFDAYANNQSIDDLIVGINDFKPDFVVLETTPTYLFWRCPPLDLSVPIKTSSAIKQSIDSTLIMIGPHGSSDPVWTRDVTGADIIVRGESDFAINKIIDGNFKNGILDVRNEPVDLKKLSFPSFNLLNLNLYEPHIWIKEFQDQIKNKGLLNLSLEFSRGCSFSCDYCFKDGFRDVFRKKTVSQMEKEFNFLADNGGGYIYFIDEIFNSPSKELNSILSLLNERNIVFGNMSRPDIMSFDLIDKFAESGCIYLEYGLETDDIDTSKIMGKNVNMNRVRDIIDYSKERIPVVSSFDLDFHSSDYVNILGLKDNPAIKWRNRPIIPYPGTYIGEQLFKMYDVKINKWDFALKYVWWLQVENSINGIQADDEIEKVKNNILFSEYKKAKDIVYSILSV